MEKRSSYAKNARVNLLNTLKKDKFLMLNGGQLTALWNSLFEDCKKNGIFFTDGLASYGKVFPAERHRVVSKRSRKKSHIERINLTFRQIVSALVRKRLSFSRSIENLTASV
ncbi:hypothetical protein LDFHOB_08540 [Candidatus Electronema aureum]